MQRVCARLAPGFGPARPRNVAVEVRQQLPPFAAVAVHDVQLRDLVAAHAVVVAGPRQHLPVWRNGHRVVRPVAIGHGLDDAPVQADPVDLGVGRVEFGVLVTVSAEVQACAVGRPGEVARGAVQPRDLQRLTAGHPANEYLHAAAVAGKVGHAIVVRRDPRAAIVDRAGGERPCIPAVEVDAPQVGAAPVLHDVHEVAGIDHEGTVGAHLRVAGIGQGKHVLGREAGPGGGKGRRREQQEQGNA